MTIQQVVALYQGELLPSCYDDWLLPLRRALHERVVNTLTKALAGLEAQHEYEVSLRTAEHLVRLDPLHEAAYRQLMQLHAHRGDRTGALRTYHDCVTMLEQELGVSPATETQALYQHLLKANAASITFTDPYPGSPYPGSTSRTCATRRSQAGVATVAAGMARGDQLSSSVRDDLGRDRSG